jgi:hypothetical protein
MELTARVNKESHIKLWLIAWNGGLKLTDKEIELTSAILNKAMNMQTAGVKEPYISELVLSSKSLIEIRNKLGLTKQGMNNYKKSLIAKKVIVNNTINPKLIPQSSLTFKFNYE